MSKHTPGPWEWETFKAPDLPQLRSRDGIICDFGSDQRYYPVEGTPPNEANARLIAAAPELLDALKAAIALYGKFGAIVNDPNAPGEWITKARAAIAKAEGGEG